MPARFTSLPPPPAAIQRFTNSHPGVKEVTRVRGESSREVARSFCSPTAQTGEGGVPSHTKKTSLCRTQKANRHLAKFRDLMYISTGANTAL